MGVFSGFALRKAFCLFALFCIVAISLPINNANAETRSLKLYFLHTGEKDEITFKRNGKYLPGGLKKINHFLRDWRRNEPTKMDPKLLDLIWEVYQEAGGRKHIHVVSGYRSLKTNNLLRKRGRGVAKKSQHSLGKAMDFFIPGVNLAKLRAISLKKGLGGVGYYPKSGSPFVHMDTGRVRHWPRMTRQQLVKVFPNGKTLHVPSDGKPLPGYNIAKARYEKATSGKIVVAKADDIVKKPSFFAKLLGKDDEDDGEEAATTPKAVAIVKAPAPSQDVAVTPSGFGQPDQNVIASLVPTGAVPAPVFAPRVPNAAITSESSPSAPELQNPDSNISPEGFLQEQQIASANIPVPVRAQRATSTLIPNTEPTTQVAALTAEEITNLRQQVYAAVNTPVGNKPAAPAPVNAQPTTVAINTQRFGPPKLNISSRMVGVPRPAGSIPGAGVSQPTIVSNGVTGATQLASRSGNDNLIGYAETESLANGNTLTAINRASVGNSQTTSALENQLTQNEAAPAPEAAPAIQPIPTTLEVEPAVQLASIPVPVQNPQRAAIQIAKVPALEPEVPPAATANRLNIEQVETANLNTRMATNWTLAADARIADIANIQPPAYGRNVLRERPNSVLSNGFTHEKIKDFTQGFSGSSVEFLNFTRLD